VQRLNEELDAAAMSSEPELEHGEDL